MTTEAFLNWTTIGIVIGGFLAFALSITGGILFVKLVNLFSKKKINPLIGATGLSAVPMASRVANEIALKYDSKNHVLQYCMASNISGVIGSAKKIVAAFMILLEAASNKRKVLLPISFTRLPNINILRLQESRLAVLYGK
mgnify:CR=1 FL=1